MRNGCTYYYALTAYDYGVSLKDPSGDSYREEPVAEPMENSTGIRFDEKGNVTYLPVNCAVVIPGSKAAGKVVTNGEIELNYNQTVGTGEIDIFVAEPDLLQTGSSYYLKFSNSVISKISMNGTDYDYRADGIEVWRKQEHGDVMVYQDVASQKHNNSILKYNPDPAFYYLPDDKQQRWHRTLEFAE